jgi:hypothetical protein
VEPLCGVTWLEKKPKKRHVERLTRLPTKRLATACWDFIVVKRGGLQTAPMLDFLPLQSANRISCAQVMHNDLWMSWGQFWQVLFVARTDKNLKREAAILVFGWNNRPQQLSVSSHTLNYRL